VKQRNKKKVRPKEKKDKKKAASKLIETALSYFIVSKN